MPNDQGLDKSPEQRRAGIRTLLLLPPFALLLIGVLLVLTSPFSWGAASVIEAPDWMPPLFGALLGIGALLLGRYALKNTLRDTKGDFEVFGLQAVAGTFLILSGSAMLLSLLVRLPSEATYEGFLDDNGAPGFGASWYFGFSAIFGAFQMGWIWAGTYLYSHAFTNQRPNRISYRRPDEVDGIGELLKERDA